ncbi:MAG: hypothetical protein NTV51_09200 [Verrucomicrobia bacterium]|nr:hypothetical protein [Verrucomicrobiota bacterium]
MKTGRLWMTVGVLAVAGFGFALRQSQAAQDAEDAGAEIARRRTAEEAEVTRLTGEARAAAEVRVALERELAALKAAPAATVEKPKPAKAKAEAETEPSIAERLQRDPEYQLLTLKHERAHIQATHGALFQKLGLSAEQIARFQDIIFKKRERDMDLQAIMGERELDWNDPVVSKLRGEIESSYRAERLALLGEAGLAAAEQYDRSHWLREMMIGWAGGAAVVAREPFTPEQGERLVEIMANASETYRKGQYVNTGEPGYWAAVAAEAKKVLTPTQYAYFTTMEPPLPMGARYQAEFYEQVSRAVRAEEKAAEKKPGG